MRIPQIEQADLNHFQFDFDTTFAVFFLNADGEIYGRYGGRDSTDDDSRMSLAGLRYAMLAALETHDKKKSERLIAKPWDSKPLYLRNIMSRGGRRGCIHCHHAKEIVNADLTRRGKWSRELVYRYPPPDNLGLTFEIDRGDIVEKIAPKTPAAAIGLKKGDVITQLNGFPVHSFADAQYALDGAPQTGAISIAWKRGGESMAGELKLAKDWRKTDIQWRPSMTRFLGSIRLYGNDLTEAEKKKFGIPAKQLAFRQQLRVNDQAREAGIRAGDIILGIDSLKLELDAYDFQRYVRRNYLAGDRVSVDLIRDGERMNKTMTLR